MIQGILKVGRFYLIVCKMEQDILTLLKDKVKSTDYAVKCDLAYELTLHTQSFERSRLYDLLKNTYPSEIESIFNYRFNAYQFITLTYFDKIINTISSVFNHNSFVFDTVKKQDSELIESKYGDYDNFLGWLSTLGLRYLLADANGYFLALPLSIWESIDYLLKPGTVLGGTNTPGYDIRFLNSDVVHFDTPTLKIIQYGEGYILGYFNYNSISISIARPKGRSGSDYEEIPVFRFDSVYTTANPFVKAKGLPVDNNVYKSFIQGVVPHWNQAVLMFSDLQGALKQHVYPERWSVASNTCDYCEGKGVIEVTNFNGVSSSYSCKSCSGTGKKPIGVYSEYRVDEAVFTAQNKPPYVGYIEKDLEPVKILNDYINQFIYSGLSAVNLEFLLDVPLNQSGVAKEMDKSDANKFIVQVSSHLINNVGIPILQWLNFLEKALDNQGLQPIIKQGDTVEIFVVKPIEFEVHIPLSVDYLSGNTQEKQISEILDSNLTITVRKHEERKFIKNKYRNDKNQQKIAIASISLDRLYGYTNEQKKQMLDSGIILKQDYIISVYIELLIKLVVEEIGQSFFNLGEIEQYNLLITKYNILFNNESR